MESVLKKFEKNVVDMSKLYGGGGWINTGRRLYGSSTNMTLSGTEYARFDEECAYIIFVSDTGGVFHLDPVC